MELASHSVAKRTWSSYRTAERMLARFCKEENKKMELPVSEDTMLGFVHWLIFKRNVKGTTVNSYIAGVRMLHIIKGAALPVLRSDFIKLVLTGVKHKETASKLRGTSPRERQPITADVMRLLKGEIKRSLYSRTEKITLWTISSLLFHGAFRGGELLGQNSSYFDPAFTLLKKDIQGTGAGQIQIRLKMPKEDKVGKSTVLEVCATDTDICPMRAFRKWQTVTEKCNSEQPAFRWDSGVPITTKHMNSVLSKALDKHNCGKFRVHSFRSGLASTMANLGCTEEEIKSMGRWSSRAYETYIKLPQVKRARAARRLTAALKQL